jgi:hypothetical protein
MKARTAASAIRARPNYDALSASANGKSSAPTPAHSLRLLRKKFLADVIGRTAQEFVGALA